jgi:hypothetical protein
MRTSTISNNTLKSAGTLVGDKLAKLFFGRGWVSALLVLWSHDTKVTWFDVQIAAASMKMRNGLKMTVVMHSGGNRVRIKSLWMIYGI